MLKKKRFILLLAILSIGLLLGMNYFFGELENDENFLRPIVKKIEKVEQQFDNDFIEILMQNRPNEPFTSSNLSINSAHPYYLFDENGRLVFWSDFTFLPDFELINSQKNQHILEDRLGIFYSKIRRFTRNEKGYWLIHLYPLYYKREIKNAYLDSGFNPEIFGNEFISISKDREEDYHEVLNSKGEFLFSVYFEEGYQQVGQRQNVVLLVFFFSLLFLVWIVGYDYVHSLWKRGRLLPAILYTALILISIRGFMIFFNFPHEYFNYQLFDPVFYASSWINPSLGDLLLNVICFTIIFILILALTGRKGFRSMFFSKRKAYPRWFFVVVVYLISTFLLSAFYWLYIDILSNAQWELNILSLPSFNFFMGISLLIVFLGGALYLLFSIMALSRIMGQDIKDRTFALKVLLYFSIPVISILIYLDWILALVYFTHLIFLISIISFQLYNNIAKLGLNTFLTFFFACLIGAIVMGIAAHEVFLKRQHQSKSSFGSQQLIENDVMAEVFLADIMDRIAADVFIKNTLVDPLQSKEVIDRKIRRIHVTNYFDQYALKIKVFNTSGDNVLDRTSSEQLQDLRMAYVKSDYLTTVKELYFVKGGDENFGNQYFAFIPLFRGNTFIGTVFLELRQLRILPGSVFPKLLMDSRYITTFNENNYDYAVYVDGVLQYEVGVFNYRSASLENTFNQESLFNTGVYRKKYHHYGVRAGDKVVVVSSPNYPVYYILADISLFFLAFILLTICAIIFYALSTGVGKFKFNYATKLQMYLNFAFFFPILIISLIILGLLTSSYQEELHRQYFQKASIVRDNLASVLERQEAGILGRDEFPEAVNNLSGTTNTDINVYNQKGYLITTSQPNIFDKRILTRYINPKALIEVMENQNNLSLLEEKVGKLRYKAVYAAIRSSDGNAVKAIIAVPFFESESELDLLIADVLSNIINIFVLVFLLFLFVSYFVSKNLTFPFKLLTQKLKATDLENNEPMFWPANDEIGMLVNEYNNMLFKLEASKKVLSNTEKEIAWREMAKQVAHEIKNPLTPMKLTLQHLLRVQMEGKLDDPEKLKKPIGTLIQQVDTLSEIATSFSTFAKMPLPNNELLDFKQVVLDTIELFKIREKEKVIFEDLSQVETIPVMGDRQLFGRVINNLIINGIQAMETDEKKAIIHLFLKIIDNQVILEIKDNGKGIPPDLMDKIFLPNFSTKSEGSGLGLAIAKRGVETVGGRIWFETKFGVGTSFFLSFDIVNQSSIED
jgi:two-component system, NtrC family, nitrogen regulation sensor histidine kinase NtrY